MSIDVKLVAETNVAPETLASHAAKTCYEPELPDLGKLIDVKARLFDTGHHTTIQHSYFTFSIEGISVSGVCNGLHLATPHYNTDQRSGRFSKMYDQLNIEEIKKHIEAYFPDQDINIILSFIQKGLDIYANNKEKITALAAQKIKQERPFVSEKYIAQNAPKFAQEQLRMFISMIAPTAMDYTVNLSTLSALWRTAWNPEMREVVAKMVDTVVSKYPELTYMFAENKRSNENWSPEYKPNKILWFWNQKPKLKTKPNLRIKKLNYDEKSFNDGKSCKDTVDTLFFSPYGMANTQRYVQTDIEISSATMCQDQRHRSIKRRAPVFTGNFYLPPLLKAAGLESDATEFMREFASLLKNPNMNQNLVSMIAPYGAMVRYTKFADMNALLHEQGKRTCWCAQEEIYHLGTQLRKQLAKKTGSSSMLVNALSPHCFKDGKCCEGARYCGRNIQDRLTADYFKNRQI